MIMIKHIMLRAIKKTCTNVSPPQCDGAIPIPLSEKWAEMARQLPRRPNHPVTPFNRLFHFSCTRPLTGCSWTATLLFLYDRTLIYSPPLTRLTILLLLLACGNVHPNPGPAPVCPTISYIPAPFVPEKLGEPQSNATAARGGSSPPASRLPGPMFSWGDVSGWICPPYSADPPHQAPTTVMNHPSTVTTIVPHLTPISPTVISITVTTTPTLTPQSSTVTPQPPTVTPQPPTETLQPPTVTPQLPTVTPLWHPFLQNIFPMQTVPPPPGFRELSP